MSEQNIELIRGGYASYARGDFQAVFALLDREIEIFQTDALPWGGSYKGHEEARRFFLKLNELTEGRPEPEHFISAGDDVIAVGRLRGRARSNGNRFDLAIVHLWTIREGQVSRFQAFIDTPAMLSALNG